MNMELIMSSYIEEARKNLAAWVETIDEETFTKQYEALEHSSEGVLLEEFVIFPQGFIDD